MLMAVAGERGITMASQWEAIACQSWRNLVGQQDQPCSGTWNGTVPEPAERRNEQGAFRSGTERRIIFAERNRETGSGTEPDPYRNVPFGTYLIVLFAIYDN